eukprot:maker-scaffold692_size110616-snap-gene-0.21 protein:Tk12303 transcript:maker-scaffold692_size110616-snap-gene-0.21-mRNA-1 annotation:"hypothetical protein TRIADDRAFT_22637"
MERRPIPAPPNGQSQTATCPFADLENRAPVNAQETCIYHQVVHSKPKKCSAEEDVPFITKSDSFQTSKHSSNLLNEIGGGDKIRQMTTRFYARAFQDQTLRLFMFETDDAANHGQRLGDWIIQKMGGEGDVWSDSGRHDMRQVSHYKAWNSKKRHPSVRGNHFKLSDCRVWMRIMFWSARDVGLDAHEPFWKWYMDFLRHFVAVYERTAPSYTKESAQWSNKASNIKTYISLSSTAPNTGTGDQKVVNEILETALKAGINYFDTSPWYGWGASEKAMGRALRHLPRNTFYISTKVGRYLPEVQDQFNFTRQKVINSVHDSLSNLGLEYLDLVQIHDVEFCHSMDQIVHHTLPALNELKTQGKVRFVGITGYNLGILKRIVELSRPGMVDTILSYGRFSLFNKDLLAYAEFFESNGVGIINASPVGMGLITPNAVPAWHPAPKDIKDKCSKAAIYCQRRGVNLPALAVKWCLHQPNFATTLNSSTSLDMLEQNLSMLGSPLSQNDSRLIEELNDKYFNAMILNQWENLEVVKYWKKMEDGGVSQPTDFHDKMPQATPIPKPPTFEEGFHDLDQVLLTSYKAIGNTDMMVSSFGLGGSGLGSVYQEVTPETAEVIVRTALSNGVNFIDTAPWYGQGKSETILGQALQKIPRTAYYIATKVGRYEQDTARQFDFTRKKIQESVTNSLQTLGLDYLDLVQIHDVEFCHSLDQIVHHAIPALQELKAAGKIRFIGITGYSLSVLKKVIEASKPGSIDTVLSYCRLTVFNRDLLAYKAFFESQGIGIINASPLGMGLLTPDGAPDWHPAIAITKDACSKAAKYCEGRKLSLPALALKWCLHQKDFPLTLTSVVNEAMLKENLALAHNPLTSEELETIGELEKACFQAMMVDNWENVEVANYWQKMRAGAHDQPSDLM